jgi:hypothetical protein
VASFALVFLFLGIFIVFFFLPLQQQPQNDSNAFVSIKRFSPKKIIPQMLPLASTPRTMSLLAAIVCVILLYVATLAFVADMSLNHSPCLVPASAECWAARLG